MSTIFHVRDGLYPNMCFMKEFTVASVGRDVSGAGFDEAIFAGADLAGAAFAAGAALVAAGCCATEVNDVNSSATANENLRMDPYPFKLRILPPLGIDGPRQRLFQ